MGAKIIRRGSLDHGHAIAICDSDECRDINGRPWQQAHPCGTVEGFRLAERDARDHNKARHSN